MTDEIRQAFAHPLSRAEASSDLSQPRDRISLRDYVVEVEIGAFQSERGTVQRVRFNIVVEVGSHADPVADDVDRILSYDRLTEAIAAELHAERLNLLETLAEHVAERILAEPQATRVFVRIEKLDRGPGALGVEIVRTREQTNAGPGRPLESIPHPHVLFLTNEAIAAPALRAWLDALEEGPEPVILCVGPPATPAPIAEQTLPQRRIDLLALEQNAWVLAGRDRRCVVVGTRTELDWAMKHGRISVWAAPKMVLDAVDGPPASLREARRLAAWFAEHMGAARLTLIGADATGVDATMPVDAHTTTVAPEDLT